MRVRELDKYHESVLSMMGMQDCQPSTNPKLEKQSEPGDDEPCEHPELYKSAVCTVLHMTRRKRDLQAAARWMCKRLRDPNQKSWRQLVKTVRYIKGTRDLTTLMRSSGNAASIEAYFDEDWAGDDDDSDKKSAWWGFYGGWLPIAQPQQDDWTTRTQHWRRRKS